MRKCRARWWWLLALLAPFGVHAADCVAPARAALVKVDGHPFGLAASADGCHLFVALGAGRDGGLAVLRNDRGGFALQRQLPLPAAATGLALSHDGAVLAVVTARGVHVFDAGKLAAGTGDMPLAVLHDPPEPRGAVYAVISQDDSLLFVSEERGRAIGVFDLRKARRGDGDHALLGRIPMPQAPVGLAASPDGRSLYATAEVDPGASGRSRCAAEGERGRSHPPGDLLRVDLADVAQHPAQAGVIKAVAGCNPVRVALTPDGRSVWVSARGSDALVRFDRAAMDGGHPTDGAALVVGSSPVGVAVRPDGRQVWTAASARFASGDQGSLKGLALDDAGAPTQRLSVDAPGFPRELIFLPDARTLAASLYDAQQVLLVPTP